MDHLLLSYHSNLAQMPTDQREHEQHLSVQTASSDAESFLLGNALQPYNPCPPGENGSAFRSNPAPGSMLPFRHPGYAGDAWGATVSNPYELDADQILWDPVPENIHHSSVYLTPQPMAPSMIAPPYSMHTHLIPSASKREENDHLSSSFLPHGNSRQRPAPIKTAEANFLFMRASTLSPSTSISSQQSPTHSLDSMSPAASATATDATSPRTSFGDNSDQDPAAEPPYSKLIWDALKSAPHNRMQLQEIYAWFEKNTSRGKDHNKGWQNSIRHNLSMNAGFEAVKVESPGKKPTNYWCLTKEAVHHGVQSTTRYRKANHRKMMGSDPPVLGRQRSGSKGGRAAKYAAKMRHNNHEEHRKERSLREPTLHRPQRPPKSPLHATPPVGAMPHYHQVPHHLHALPVPNGLPPVTKDPSIHSFDLSTVIGCTSPPPGDHAMICDAVEPTPNYTAFQMGQFSWYGL